jgi:hypothetical protein
MEPLLIRFSDPATKWLRAEAKRLGIAVAEVLRRIVDEKRVVFIKADENQK